MTASEASSLAAFLRTIEPQYLASLEHVEAVLKDKGHEQGIMPLDELSFNLTAARGVLDVAIARGEFGEGQGVGEGLVLPESVRGNGTLL